MVTSVFDGISKHENDVPQTNFFLHSEKLWYEGFTFPSLYFDGLSQNGLRPINTED